MNIKPAVVSAIGLFQKGREELQRRHQEKAKKTQGNLRGGNSGCMVGDTVIGKCHRVSLARLEGIDQPVDAKSQDIFDAGYLNEEVWKRNLEVAWDGPIKYEEQTPGKWSVTSGSGKETLVTFSPDTELGRWEDGGNPANGMEFVPEVGLEYKIIVSDSQGLQKFYKPRPNTDNLCQTGHYSMKKGIPYILVYAYHSMASIPGMAWWWSRKKFNIPEDVKKLNPFKVEFKIGWENGSLYFLTGKGERVDTLITAEGIEEYYTLVADMKEQKALYTRFKSKEYDLSDAPFDHCNYCPFESACDETEDYQVWLDKIQLIVENSKR